MAAIPPSGTVTLLFTDIEGSTKRWEHLPAAMASALMTHDLLLRAAIEEHEGFVFKTVGDAFCAAFADPAAAVTAALAAQRGLAAERWGEVGHVRVRMALHTGDPEGRDRDYFGPPVNRVARILSTGAGAQVLVSAATAALVGERLPAGATLRDLGAHRLKDLLQPERIFQLAAPDLPAEFPPLKSLDRQPHNLPAQPTPLVGREAEVARVRELVEAENARLVTLTGPGGTGKTRLALQAAAESVDAFPDGAWFADLAPLIHADLVAGAIAQPLGVREAGHEPLEATLLDYLRDKKLLLVLDNFEHVLPAVPLVGRLLGACPGVVALATSRAALRAYGEREVPVPPLALPNPMRLPPLAELATVPAVALFVERAQAVKPGFDLTGENAAAVAGTCVRLEGLPLAIELAAARVRILSPDKLLERLARRLDLLTGGAADRHDRQRTLRGAIAWSHDLLPPEQQTLFRRLAVFAGGATFEAVEAVADPDGALDVLDGLEALVTQSLLRQEDGPGGEVRFRMLETIREFGLEQLATHDEEASVRQAHADLFLDFAETADRRLSEEDQALWLDRLETEHDNLRAALAWNTESDDANAAQRLAGALARFWYVHGHLTEGRSWLGRGLAAGDATPDTTRAWALAAAGWLAWAQGDLPPARDALEQALAVYEGLPDNPNLPLIFGYLGQVVRDEGDLDLAQAYYEDCLAEYRRLGDHYGVADALNWLGILELSRGNYDRATTHYEEQLAVRRQLNDRQMTTYALFNLGEARHHQGDLAGARALYDEVLPVFRELGDKGATAQALWGLGRLDLHGGDPAAALPLLREGLELAAEIGDKGLIAFCLQDLAGAAAAGGDGPRAARLLGAAEALREAIGSPLRVANHPDHDRYEAAARAALDPAAFATAWAAGRSLPLLRAFAEAAEIG